jgi:IS605 OrfB family transposase
VLAYKYRAYPTDSQVEEIRDHFDIHASIYNRTLETIDKSGEWVSKYDMFKELTQWKKDDSNDFDCVNAKAAQKTVGRVYDAISGLSTLKKKGKHVGKLRHRSSFNSIESPHVVGIDFNISNLFTDSDGRMFESLWEYLQPKLEKVDWEHQKLSRKEYGSQNWEKQKIKLSKAYDDLKRARDDVLHKLSRWYVDTFDAIALEEVGSEHLSSGPVKYIKEQAWRKFQEYVQYKASHAGVETFEVSPEYTSQDCSNCENRVEKKLSDRSHDCEECGLTIDRDLNAARNVVQKAISSTVGTGYPELTPFETDSAGEIQHISLRTVVEEGSPTPQGANSLASRVG